MISDIAQAVSSVDNDWPASRAASSVGQLVMTEDPPFVP
jgi:hypothetical protein